ncbi:hypothetical protein IWX90DRAFT_157128 [Phyllosticta citrichinensis]|uniref:Secreted protein n=1 Tax=Phyllosticta citrichinensis TaxID=1130410 RepID=A0ABR1Y056_9PEZI
MPWYWILSELLAPSSIEPGLATVSTFFPFSHFPIFTQSSISRQRCAPNGPIELNRTADAAYITATTLLARVASDTFRRVNPV